MSLIQWNPFREMEAFARRFNELFTVPMLGTFDWKPTVDIHETPENFLVTAELPGMKREDVNVSLEGGVLTLTGERKSETETKEQKAHRIERSYGRFERSFALPETVDPDKVLAEFRDGLLNVKLAKRPMPQSRAKRIAIN